MLTISIVDVIPILFCLAGLVIPQFYTRTRYKAVVVIFCMFLVSFLGSWVVHVLAPKSDFGMSFSRLFSLIGISHITFISVQSSMYWRLILERIGLHKKEEEDL
jgi:hypothetical protein